jgi:hypothetical protein
MQNDFVPSATRELLKRCTTNFHRLKATLVIFGGSGKIERQSA